eukprot:5954204-Karenia_brevis.AAC.1
MLKALFRQYPTRFKCDQRHMHNVLAGLDGHGNFRTSPAKQCPPRLCYMMSYALVHDIRVRLRSRPNRELPQEENIDVQAQTYFVPLDPYDDKQALGNFGNGFHGRAFQT